MKRKSIVAISFSGSLLFFVACATNRIAPAIPVHITVNGTTDIRGGVAGDVRFATMSAIARRAPSARELTVAVTVDEHRPDEVSTEPLEYGYYSRFGQPQERMTVPSLNPDPTSGESPTVSVGGTGLPAQYAPPIAENELRVAYTIMDTNGRLLESDNFITNPYGTSERLEIRQTAEIIAARVRALSSTR